MKLQNLLCKNMNKRRRVSLGSFTNWGKILFIKLIIFRITSASSGVTDNYPLNLPYIYQIFKGHSNCYLFFFFVYLGYWGYRGEEMVGVDDVLSCFGGVWVVFWGSQCVPVLPPLTHPIVFSFLPSRVNTSKVPGQ
jgi:hypothetical protein